MLQTIVSACFSLTLYIMLEVKIKFRLKAFNLNFILKYIDSQFLHEQYAA